MRFRPLVTLESIVQDHKDKLKDKETVRKGSEDLLKKPVKRVTKLT